ncbi:phasin [Paraburkholderia monticola]|uniref:Phasin n=1 Tax=Paraburkholderia monticola TaxID=1399968 RepID=A0A149PG62_9BURK|nr:phasin family protein [Paraburkholderia monticola]KXU83856.1 phasin [Paraburkholderia monticola]
MFFYSPQQIADLHKAGYQSFVNLTGKYMKGLQEVAELNVQTMKTIIEESNNFPMDDVTESANNLPEWQSSMLSQLPGKVTSYNRHLHTIILSTGAEVAREVRRQYESRGGQVNAIFLEAIEKANATSTRTAETPENTVTKPAQDAVETTVKDAVESASSDAISQTAKATGDFLAGGEAMLPQPARSGNKR